MRLLRIYTKKFRWFQNSFITIEYTIMFVDIIKISK